MDFGRVHPSQLDLIDFHLPADHSDNTRILPGAPNDSPGIYIGCAKWGRPDWVGKLYPKGTKSKDFLEHYARQFNSIELNPTHYRIPEPHIVERWVNMVPEDFLFFPKVFQGISHWDRLKDERGVTAHFCDTVRLFGTHLGTVFLQLHPSFTPKSFDVLEAYLRSWPADIRLALELRDKRWFLEQETSNRLFALLQELNIASVITDTGGFRELVHMRLSTPDTFIRFVGNSLHPTDYTRIDDWIDRMGQWLNQGMENIWFFMHQHEELHSPELIHYMALEMKKKLGLRVQVPQLHSEDAQQGDLFS